MNISHLYSSLAFRISLLVLMAGFIPMMIFLIVSIHYTQIQTTDTLSRELKEKSVIVAREIDRQIVNISHQVRVLSQSDLFEGKDYNAMDRYLTEVLAESSSFSDIDIVSTKGEILSSSGNGLEQGKQISHLYPDLDPLYQRALKSKQGSVFASKPQFFDTGAAMVFLSPITDDSNQIVISVLMIEVNLSPIETIVQEFREGITGDQHVYIVDREGYVLVTSNPDIPRFNPLPDFSVNSQIK